MLLETENPKKVFRNNGQFSLCRARANGELKNARKSVPSSLLSCLIIPLDDWLELVLDWRTKDNRQERARQQIRWRSSHHRLCTSTWKNAGDTIMNTVTIIELKRYGWRQKIVKGSFVISGKPPYVELIKPKKLLKKALPNRKRRCFVGEYLFLQTR
jgi:hypothetical protein